jgi:hypothetical protein
LEDRYSFLTENVNTHLSTIQNKMEAINSRVQSLEGAGWRH